MAPKKGQRLGGIYELEDLRIRCHIDADCGCWRWRLRLNRAGAAECCLMLDGKKLDITGRRAALLLAGVKPKPDQPEAMPKPNCPHIDCVNPAHSQWGNRSERQKGLADRGRWGEPSHYAAIVASARARRKLDEQHRMAVACSNEPGSVIAARLGVSESLISSIRRGHTLRSAARSVFDWRP